MTKYKTEMLKFEKESYFVIITILLILSSLFCGYKLYGFSIKLLISSWCMISIMKIITDNKNGE